jgi:hypothetical protein
MSGLLKKEATPPPEGAQEQSYDSVRDSIRTGDVLLFRGTSFLSKAIHRFTGSPYSHAGFAIWWDTRLLCFQSAGRGVEVLPLSSAVDTYDGRVDLYRLRDDALAKVDTEKLITLAIEMLGRKYFTFGLLTVAWRILTRSLRGRKDVKTAPSEAFCSQYLSYCYREAGLDLVPELDDASTSPGDLEKSEYLTLQAVLRDDAATQARRDATQQALPGKAKRRKPV